MPLPAQTGGEALSALLFAQTFLEGILAFVSPCILPLLPVYVMYLAGDRPRGRGLANVLMFVLGFTLVFTLLGAGASTLGGLLTEHRGVLERIFGAVTALLGLHYMGALRIGWLNREARINYQPERLGPLRALLFGAAFSIGWTPCVGAFLGKAMMIAATAGRVLPGMALLLTFSLGLGVPFVASALLYNRLARPLQWLKRHQRAISVAAGALLALYGLAMALGLTGYYNGLFR